MRELAWQERPNKKARLAERKVRFRGERPNIGPTGAANSGRPQNHVEETVTPKRGHSMGDNGTPNKMRKGYDPRHSYCSNNMASTGSDMVAAMPENGTSEQYKVAVLHGLSRQRSVSQQHPNLLFRASAASASHRNRSSPYTQLETAQQRRKSRERKMEKRRLQNIERDVHAQQDTIGRKEQRQSVNPENESPGGSVLAQSVTSGARPKERLKEDSGNKNTDPHGVERHDCKRNALKTGAYENYNEKRNEKTAILRLNVQKPETQNQSGIISRDGQARDGRSESEGSDQGLFKNELVTQLIDNYADSQTMVKNLRLINEQYAGKVETLDVQLSVFENRHQEDKLRIETQCAELKQFREDYAEKFACMCERTEAFDRRHRELQAIFDQQQQQQTALSTQLAQTTENRRLELAQFEQLKLDSQRELASQQRDLTACHTRLERLHSAISRQRECLECSICLGVFSRPVTLNCGHTFCEGCIDTNRRSAAQPDCCPLCRQFIGTAVRSAVVSQLAELTQELEDCHV